MRGRTVRRGDGGERVIDAGKELERACHSGGGKQSAAAQRVLLGVTRTGCRHCSGWHRAQADGRSQDTGG
ncbi:hypothetical protein GCM10018779_37790 [Streptomyces griseocarneus]|nr:hypothetical protein GCM10018779_37790 [Streptomyces griseocarneus]